MKVVLHIGVTLLAMTAGYAVAETAVVRGGEHVDFTRIVINASNTEGWSFGRTSQGYGFVASREIEDYDTRQAFDKIPKERLSGIVYDGRERILNFVVPCVCYAIAFQASSTMVAIDIRSGVAPSDSVFEYQLNEIIGGGGAGSGVIVSDNEVMNDEFSMLDWYFGEKNMAKNKYAQQYFNYDLSLVEAENSNQIDVHKEIVPLRDALLLQIERGVADGVVQSWADIPEHEIYSGLLGDALGFRVSNGELPGLHTATRTNPAPNLTIDGRPCLPEQLTDVGRWAQASQYTSEISRARADLLGEFDEPDGTAVLEAVKAFIGLGFGAEARQILELLPDAKDIEAYHPLRDLTYLVDLEIGPEGAFDGMETCDTVAALWAVLSLALDGGDAGYGAPNGAAIARSFSELPKDLRDHVGPPIAEYLLSIGENETAYRLRSTMMRSSGDHDRAILLLDAEFDIVNGNATDALSVATAVSEDPGPNAAHAAIIIAESSYNIKRAVEDDLADELKALSVDYSYGLPQARMKRAEILSLAMSGRFESAFSLLPQDRASSEDLWRVAVELAPDDIFIIEAVKSKESFSGARDVNVKVARRLLSHGFYEDALRWLGPPDKFQEADESRLAAEGLCCTIRPAHGFMFVSQRVRLAL
ncbi:hypothetical protein HOY34_21755 [Xinfangfangia sp. D13-10-4-6]|uniref:hypothetical protein n=1 Tax=Pseudogemmobacter hezensis TaxID=2737662 RepID=UPI0015524116|nr:hypothetical protein [Pseudogemmobacter hezensis]NPD17794.1 hypothetical protein [Pseudogemmobacter hezensis]